MRTPLRTFRSAPALSGFLLLMTAACNSQPENIVVGPPDDMKDQLAHAKPVELPPAVAASKTYRCKDNSVVYVDFFADQKSANIRTKVGGTPTMVKSDEAGKPMVADGGYSLSGSAKGSSVTLAMPGKPSQGCDA